MPRSLMRFYSLTVGAQTDPEMFLVFSNFSRCCLTKILSLL
jgi:hypothetical protein